MHLGLDVGTSSVKGLLVDEAGAVLAGAEARLTVRRPAPGHSEQDPDDWWRAVRAVLGDLRRQRPKEYGAVRGLGVAGQMHAALLLGGDDAPLRPAVLWDDARAGAECAVLRARCPEVASIAGVAPMPGLTAPKLLWLAKHEPEAFRAARCLLNAADYVRLKLTGERATDVSDAAGTLLFDQAGRTWSADLAGAAEIDTNLLPRLVEGTDPAGTLRPETAAALGLPSGVTVVGGAGDTPAAAVGIGAVNPGDAFVQLGTSAQIFVATAAYAPRPNLVHAFAHALPERWYAMAALLNGASALGWAANLLGHTDVGRLVADVEAAYRGPSKLLFLPYLAGERTPHDDPLARGVLFGMDRATGPLDVAQAVMEGVGFALRAAQDALGDAPLAYALVGGGARGTFWPRLLASILDRPLTLYVGGERGAAYGAARLARGGDFPPPAVARVVEPEPDLVGAYQEPARGFDALYRALRPLFKGG